MTETDWELKDRRIAWQTITKALAEVQAALIISKSIKFSSLKDAMEDLNMSRDIELSAFLVIERKSHRGIGGPAEDKVEQNDSSPSASFIHSVGSVAPLPSPNKKNKKIDVGAWVCSECAKAISTRVKEFSEDKYKRSLCYDCQKKIEQNIEEACGPGDIGKY